MPTDRSALRLAIATTIQRLSEVDVTPPDARQIIEHLDDATRPLFEALIRLMVASHAPLRRPPPTEVGIAAGFVHDAQVIEDAGRRLQDLLTDPERLVAQRQNFPDTDAGYLIAQAAAALCNLMDLSFPTSGRIRLEQPVRFCEIRTGDRDNRLVLSSWWPAEL